VKTKRPLLLPFSPIYGFITWIRNKFFDWGWLKSTTFNFPVIAVGNLNVGGTGKTPHTIWLLNLIGNKLNTGVVSRGYGRETKGYILANENSTSKEIGDEPKEIAQRFPNINLAVAEKRVEGIKNLKSETSTEAIILDDAFQHRYAKAGMYILLSTYNDLFTRERILPGGNLREYRSGYKRADIIIVSKCPEGLNKIERNQITKEIDPYPHQKVAFSYYKYGRPLNKDGQSFDLPKHFLLVTGIAHTSYLRSYLINSLSKFQHFYFKDHHNFEEKDYAEMKKRCRDFNTHIVLTTSKDFARIDLNHPAISDLNVWHLPIDVDFIQGKDEVEKEVLSFVAS